MTTEKFIHLLTHARGLPRAFVDKARAAAAAMAEGPQRDALKAAIAAADVAPAPRARKQAAAAES